MLVHCVHVYVHAFVGIHSHVRDVLTLQAAKL